jgi:hypothetical protein
MSGLLLAAALIAAQPAAAQPAPAAPAAPASLPYSVTFARTGLGPWKIEAKTIVDDTTGLPMIETARCDIERDGLELSTWPQGGIWFRLEGSIGPTGLGFGSSAIRRVGFDGDVWELRWIEAARPFERFVDVDYPPTPTPEPCYGCVSTTYGHWASRRRPGDPYFTPQVLANRLVQAGAVRIGFQEEADEGAARGPMLWAEIPLAGLDGALAWCREAMASDRSLRFHGGLGR